MGMAYVRKYYGIPAKRGCRIKYTGEKEVRYGVVTSATNGRINVRFDGEMHTSHMHPTWEMEYLVKEGNTT